MTDDDYQVVLLWILLIFIAGTMVIRRRRRIQIANLVMIHETRTIEYMIVNESPNENDDCCICLIQLNELDLEITDKIIKTNCNHYYHKFCLIKWINSDNELRFKCPLCLENL